MHPAVLISRLLASQVSHGTLWCLPPVLCSYGLSDRLQRNHRQVQRRQQWNSSAANTGSTTLNKLQLMDSIHLRGLMFHGYHGVLPEENTLGQKFLVDATLFCGDMGLQAAGVSDNLAASVNYAAVYESIRQVMEGPPFKLLEAVAETMCDRVLSEESRVLAMRVHVRKPHVSLTGPLESVGVEILRSRPG